MNEQVSQAGDEGDAALGRQYFRDRDLCARYGVSRATIWRWASCGMFPAPHKIGGSTRWRLDEILEYESRAAEGA